MHLDFNSPFCIFMLGHIGSILPYMLKHGVLILGSLDPRFAEFYNLRYILFFDIYNFLDSESYNCFHVMPRF